MGKSILGADQIRKVNEAYAPLLTHLRNLLTADRTPYGLMNVHHMVESLDSTEMYQIFSGLSFLSPTEKRALVRAAVYEIVQTTPHSMEAWDVVDVKLRETAAPSLGIPAIFTPPPFKLNVATTQAMKEGQTMTTQTAPETSVKPTALEIIPAMKAEADAINEKSQAERDAAVKIVRETPAIEQA